MNNIEEMEIVDEKKPIVEVDIAMNIITEVS